MAKRTEVISVRISEEEKEALAAIAKKRDIPVSQLIRETCKLIIQKGGE